MKSYISAEPELTHAIHEKNKGIAQKLNIDDRVDTMAEEDAFITLKDHKPNFTDKPIYRLVNPVKSDIGKVSKKILDRINTTIVQKCKFNKWKGTKSVINWFKNIKSKQHSHFICFDMEEFNHSISQDLLNRALVFASRYTNITAEERGIIIYSKR